MKRILSWSTVASLLLACFVTVAVAQFVAEARGSAEPPGWISIARIVVAVLAVLGFIYMHFLERHIRAQRDELSKKGQDPEFVVFISGAAMFFAPTCYGLVLVSLGGPLTDIYLWASVSFLGVVWWAWRQRAYLTGSGSGPVKKSEVQFARSYTVVLAFTGSVALLALALEILSQLLSAERASTGMTTALVIIPFMAVVSAGCWATVLLRVRKSPHAIAATKITSIVLIFGIPVLGFLVFVYWLLWIRKRESA